MKNEPTKTCTKCGEEKPLSEFAVNAGRRRADCKECHRKKMREGYHKYKNKRRLYENNYRKNSQKYKAGLRARYKRYVKSGGDGYVRTLLKKEGFSKEQITEELIAAKLSLLKLKRAVWEIKE